MINLRCQLEDTEVNVEQMVAFDDVEGKGSLFGTVGIDMFASIGEVGRVEIILMYPHKFNHVIINTKLLYTAVEPKILPLEIQLIYTI